jgi:hypothetical protein
MKPTCKFLSSVAAFLTLSLISCASTTLVDTYKDKAYEGRMLESVMVVAITENVRNRTVFEGRFSDEFKRRGIQSIPSTDVIPSDEDATKDAIKAAAVDKEMNAVLVTHLVAVEEKEVYNPPPYSTYWGPHGTLGPHGNFGPYYSNVYGYVHAGGYYTKHKLVRLETNIYDTESEKLIWSASSETFEPGSANKTIEDLCKVIMKKLTDDKMIGPAKK